MLDFNMQLLWRMRIAFVVISPHDTHSVNVIFYLIAVADI